MLDILRTYLMDASTPETREAIEEACRLFNNFGLEGYEDHYNNALLSDSNTDAQYTLSIIINDTMNFQKQILNQHGVFLGADTSIEFNNKLIEGLFQIQDYEDQTQIHQVCDMDINPTEKFCELMALVTTLSVEDILPNLVAVEEALVVSVKQLFPEDQERVLVTADDQAAFQKQIDTYNFFCRHIAEKPPLVPQLLTDGMAVGYEFIVYANRLREQYDLLSVKDAARALVATALISSDGLANPRSVITPYIETAIHDATKATQVDIAVNDIILGLRL